MAVLRGGRDSGRSHAARLSPSGHRLGNAFITLNREIRESLWERVQRGKGKALEGIDKPTTEWLKPGLVGRVRHLKASQAAARDVEEIRDDDLA